MSPNYTYSSFVDLSLRLFNEVSAHSPTQSYQIICQSIASTLKWEYAEVWIRDNKKPVLVQSDIYYSTNRATELFAKVRVKPTFEFGEGLPGRAWSQKKTFWIDDLSNESTFLRQTEAKKARLVSCMVTPILAEDYVDAVIIFFSKSRHKPNPRLMHLMDTLSAHLGSKIIKLQLETIKNEYVHDANRSVDLISKIFSLRDPYTITHEALVRTFSAKLGERLNFSSTQLSDLNYASILHDIGKISIPMEILSKPSKLTSAEYELIKTHVMTGYELIKDLNFNNNVKLMVLQHHERNDGSGYPNKLQESEILIGSQVLAVADVVSAMIENRPYRPAYSIDYTIKELIAGIGIKFNRQIVNYAIDILNMDYRH